MNTWVLCDQYASFNDLPLLLIADRLLHSELLLLPIRESLELFLAHRTFVLLPIVVLHLDEDLIFLKQALLVGDTDQDASVSHLDPRFVLQTERLTENHVAKYLIKQGLSHHRERLVVLSLLSLVTSY